MERITRNNTSNAIRLCAMLTIWLLFSGVTMNAKDKPMDSESFHIALKSNMLSDLLLIPDIGAEFYLGKSVSVGADFRYAWWSKNSAHRFWRITALDIYSRYWFSRKPLTGHHAGIHLAIATFDFELGGKGIMGGTPQHLGLCHPWWLGGVEYGYSLPLNSRLNIDFSIGVGCAAGRLIKYKPEGKEYDVISDRHRLLLIPTKAEIALVWLLQ